MDEKLKQRLVGAIVLVALGVIFIPMLLDGDPQSVGLDESNIPLKPFTITPPVAHIVPVEKPPIVEAPQPPSEPTTAPTTKKTAKASVVVKPAGVKKPESKPKSSVKAKDVRQQLDANLKSWVVQVATLASEKNAKALRSRLRKAGFQAFVEPLVKAGKRSFRVRVGPELDQKRAERLKGRIAAKLKLQGIVLRYR